MSDDELVRLKQCLRVYQSGYLGPLLDAWEQLPTDIRLDDELDTLRSHIERLESAMHKEPTDDERYNHVNRFESGDDWFTVETHRGLLTFNKIAEQGSWGPHLSVEYDDEPTDDHADIGDINVDEALSLAKSLTEWAESQR